MADAASALPANDGLRNFITKFMVHGLFGSLHHPPLSYKGAEFQQRAADGGNNVRSAVHGIKLITLTTCSRTFFFLRWARLGCRMQRPCQA